MYLGKTEDLFDTKKKEITENLYVAHRVCLTIDHWSNSRKGLVGKTVHWYTNDLVRHNTCTALHQATSRNTCDVFARLIEAVIVECNSHALRDRFRIKVKNFC